jgi:hypothetical protein
LWATAWAKPQAVEWERCWLEIQVALYVRSLAAAERPGAPLGCLRLVTRWQTALGLTASSMLALHWRVDDDHGTSPPPKETHR